MLYSAHAYSLNSVVLFFSSGHHYRYRILAHSHPIHPSSSPPACTPPRMRQACMLLCTTRVERLDLVDSHRILCPSPNSPSQSDGNEPPTPCGNRACASSTRRRTLVAWAATPNYHYITKCLQQSILPIVCPAHAPMHAHCPGRHISADPRPCSPQPAVGG